MKKVLKYKVSRRLDTPLFEKCQTQKFALREQQRPQKFRRGIVSDFGKQLLEKQKLRYLYSINERALRKYVTDAIRFHKTRNTTKERALEILLERRLDSVVYRLGLADTRRMARQMVSHGHFTVNGRKMTIPSYQVKDKDIIGIREGSKQTKLLQTTLAKLKTSPAAWVQWDGKSQTGSLKAEPEGEGSLINLSMALEYYSRN